MHRTQNIRMLAMAMVVMLSVTVFAGLVSQDSDALTVPDEYWTSASTSGTVDGAFTYSWSYGVGDAFPSSNMVLESGSLPAGLTASLTASTGTITISGTPTATGTYNPWYSFEDTTGNNGYYNWGLKLTITVNAASMYTVAYDSALGTVPSAVTVTGGSSVVLPTLSYTGYVLDGWRLGSISGTLYDPGSSYTVTDNVTFYADWTATYTLTVTAGTGGTVTGGGSYVSGATAMLVATADADYSFVSWSDGNTEASRSVTVIGDATYTATFAAFTVTFTAPTTTDPTVNLTATIAAFGENVDLSAATYNWYVVSEDSSTITQGFQKTFSYTFTESGTYTIRVVVNSTNYGSAEHEETVTVEAPRGGGGEDDTPYWVYAACVGAVISALVALIAIFAGRYEIVVIGAIIAVAIAVALHFGGYI